MKYYIGLSVTYHDPALAIIDEQGKVLFAEATERYMQNKEYYKDTFNIDLKSDYEIKMIGNNNKYKIYFNNKFKYEIDLKN